MKKLVTRCITWGVDIEKWIPFDKIFNRKGCH